MTWPVIAWLMPWRRRDHQPSHHATADDLDATLERALSAQQRSGDASDSVVQAAGDHVRRIEETVVRIQAMEVARCSSHSRERVSEVRNNVEAALRQMDQRTMQEGKP